MLGGHLVSLIFWSVTIIVTVIYVGLVLRADSDGEAGILSLITLVARPGRRPPRPSRTRTLVMLSVLGIFGASLFLADSMITPAISVLSAVEGLRLVQPRLETFVIPITIVIIIALFAAQRVGTAQVGRLFGPVMTLWFLAIGAAGVLGVVKEPGILRALSPRTPSASQPGNPGLRSSHWRRSCWPSPAPRPCTQTWVTSDAPRPPAPG